MKKIIAIIFLLSSPAFTESYKFVGLSGSVQRQSDGAFIPVDQKNKDYMEYQVWVASGNVTFPADLPLTDVQILSELRTAAINSFANNTQAIFKVIRAVLMVLFDENNNSREWIQAFKGQVALATSLADLKTRVAALPDMPDRTVAQAKNAVQVKINSGDPD